MPLDPFGIDQYHDSVLERIDRGEKGLAHSRVGNVRVSYEVGKSITHGPVIDRTIQSILDEMILDVARGDGKAGPETFAHSRVRFAIDNRREFPADWKEMHAEADLLEQFYFGDGGGGKYLR